MRTLLIAFFTILFSTTTLSSAINQSKDVYLCNSENGKKYHFSSNCRGLKACTHPIIKVTLSEAKKRGKTICGYED